MANTPRKHPEPIGDVFDQQKLDQAGEAVQTLAQLQGNYNQGRDLLNQILGEAQMAGAISDFSRTVRTSRMAHIKESKLYRLLEGVNSARCGVLNGTWEDFCKMLGTSVDQADRDIANLKAFGEQALEAMQSVGIGYRDLRQFRKLPEDEKTALIEVAKSGDKEGLLELAEELIAKQQKEKAALSKQVEDALANAKAAESVAAGKQRLLDEKNKELDRWREKAVNAPTPAPQPDHVANELVHRAHEAEATACAWIEGHLRQAIDALIDHDNVEGSDHRAVLSGFIARIEDATDRLRMQFSLPRLKDDPFEELPDDFLAQQGLVMPTPINHP